MLHSTVAVAPDTIEAGAIASEASVTVGVTGVTVIRAYWFAPPVPAVTYNAVEAVTGPAVTVKIALVWPPGTV